MECNSKCLKACPYDAPQFGPERGSKMRKCNYCVERFEQNLKPVCVEACRTRALDAGSLEELKAKYKENHNAVKFVYSERTKPAIIFKPKLKKNNI